MAPFTKRGQVGEEVDVRRCSSTDEALKCSFAVDCVAEMERIFRRRDALKGGQRRAPAGWAGGACHRSGRTRWLCPPYHASMLFFLSWDQSRPYRIVGLPGTMTDQWRLRKCTLPKLHRCRKPYRLSFMAARSVSFIGLPRSWSRSDTTSHCMQAATR